MFQAGHGAIPRPTVPIALFAEAGSHPNTVRLACHAAAGKTRTGLSLGLGRHAPDFARLLYQPPKYHLAKFRPVEQLIGARHPFVAGVKAA